MDPSISLKDQIWFLRVCHHVSNVLYVDVWVKTLQEGNVAVDYRVRGIALFTFEVRHTNLVRTRQPDICRASLTAQYQGAANLNCMCSVLPATGIPIYLQRQTFCT